MGFWNLLARAFDGVADAKPDLFIVVHETQLGEGWNYGSSKGGVPLSL